MAGEDKIDAPNAAFDLRSSLEAAVDRQQDAPEPNAEPEAPVEAEKPARDDGRDEFGRFAKKEEPEEPKAEGEKVEAKPEGEEPEAQEQTEEPKPVEAAPPPGWSVAAKAAWNDLPDAVREAIAKREEEVSNGFSQYKGMGDLKPYAEAYAREGATVKQALDGYLALDRLLYQDPLRAMHEICRGRNLDPRKIGAAMAGIALQQPQDGQQGQAAPQQPYDPNNPLVARLSQLEQHILEQQRQAQQQTMAGVASEVEAFAKDPKHPFFENVKATMGTLIQAGVATDLSDAYEKACKLDPEINALLIKQQQAAAEKAAQAKRQAAATQAKQSAKGITGSPTPGSVSGGTASSRKDVRSTIADALDRQFARA